MLKLFETERLEALVVDERAARQLLCYEKENREHFAQFSPLRDDRYYTLGNVQKLCEKQASLYKQERKLPLVFVRKGHSAIVATASLSDITYGTLQSATLGYSTAQKWQRQGIGSEAVKATIDYAFDTLNLHRLEATIMTKNYPSLGFAESLGFVCEGIAREYLFLHGKWEDYCRMALLGGREV
ncbi:GNAT family protein [Sphaerochaeta sp. PS]|uniref:GNAT family N-acetyltransferase n=1 Tax=Sphaerochaeta sp. PS TaxID=3076336 RepID=UPI0028A3FFD0|nr:GNAT family protein [Sphaerochaeta sp. PS]MDT4762359.1 GNAT family protein [Sphaerochaeta sp. PS]